ncbi:MAG TPA: type IV secretion system DNA-binding domain-containing protein [Anaerolineaceae bacterium]|nr:type IV secretion system DNA-binding domain-containing protein [Anaerolineaceae bacterium]
MDINGSDFYFGRQYDLAAKQALADKLVLYDPTDLTTHAVITGMTGSGKTGMGIILLEEAALQGIPAILIDPKGDLTNHLLHFPDLLPSDFAPWIDADSAKREGKSVEQAAEDAAALWSKGLAGWGIDKTRIEKLKKSVDYAVYTPGSNSALSVSILSSLKCPNLNWEENKEMLRENISSTVTALLELVGLKNIDPVRSREHILLSNIFETSWSSGKDLDLESLILQTQNPPFEKLGVFPVSKFYPEKDRFDLAMLLNNFLAAPAFESWLQGQPLDIASFLYSPDGKPRHSIFYLAHLADAERMFFITLLYSAIETWMRTQAGTTNLRALVYFDEIVGYLPPVASPPSKPIILRMLKQARAFGVGLVLATQNPIDLDYKALSNAGTWIIGKLQTDQDKQRLLDGLDSLADGLDRAYFDKTISALGKRVFILHNVHAKAPVVFTTRWAMNYLPGPITRNKLADLNRLVGAEAALTSAAAISTSDAGGAAAGVSAAEGKGGARADQPGLMVEPRLSSKVGVYYLPFNRNLSEALREAAAQLGGTASNPLYHYQPVLLGQAAVYFANRTYNVDTQTKITVQISRLEGRGLVRWEDYQTAPVDSSTLDSTPLPNATFGDLVYPLYDEQNFSALSKDFMEWVYRSQTLKLFSNDALKLVSQPGESREAFEARCAAASSGSGSEGVDKIREKYAKLKKPVEDKKLREELELERDRIVYNQRRSEEAMKGFENVAKLFTGRKSNLSSSLSKRRMTAVAKANVEESEEMIRKYEAELADLDAKMQSEIQDFIDKGTQSAGTIREVTVAPLKKDIVVELFGLAWKPVYAFKKGNEWLFIPANV